MGKMTRFMENLEMKVVKSGDFQKISLFWYIIFNNGLVWRILSLSGENSDFTGETVDLAIKSPDNGHGGNFGWPLFCIGPEFHIG
jgi:hypothetical protein